MPKIKLWNTLFHLIQFYDSVIETKNKFLPKETRQWKSFHKTYNQADILSHLCNQLTSKNILLNCILPPKKPLITNSFNIQFDIPYVIKETIKCTSIKLLYLINITSLLVEFIHNNISIKRIQINKIHFIIHAIVCQYSFTDIEDFFQLHISYPLHYS